MAEDGNSRYAASLAAGRATPPSQEIDPRARARYANSLAAGKQTTPAGRYANSLAAGKTQTPPSQEIDPRARARYANTIAAMRAEKATSGDRYANTRAAIAASAPPPAAAAAKPPARTEAERLAARYPNSVPAQPAPALELEAPEGFDAAAPEFTAFRELAGELRLDQGNAGRLLGLHQKALEAQQAAHAAEVEGWRAATEADAELVAGAAAGAQLAAEFGGRELLDLLDETGLGNHPALVRLLVRTAKALR